MEPQFILISRFNWPHPAWNTRTEQEYLDWVQGRLKLFADLTAPSVRNGHGKIDRWLILIDTRKVDIRTELKAITRGLPVQLVEYFGHDLVRSVRGALSDLTFPARVMTCRLDTDDLVGASFVKSYRAAEIDAEEAREGVVLSFPGVAVYAADEQRFYFSSYPENPFLCYVEDRASADDLQTVYRAMHVDMIEVSAHVRMLHTFRPAWASVVHGDNVANQSLMGVARSPFAETRKIMRYFGIPAPARPPQSRFAQLRRSWRKLLQR